MKRSSDWSAGNDVTANEIAATATTTATATPNATTTTTPPFFFYQKEQLTFLYILFVLIVIGNSLVIVSILLTNTRKSRMHTFILNLAIADLLAGLVSVLTDIVWKNTVEWHAGNVGCKVVRYGQSVVTYGSSYALVALSLDRLNAIARPMSFSQDKVRTRVLIGLAWGLSFLFSLPMLVINEELRVKGGGFNCNIEFPYLWNWKLYITSISVAVFVIPAIIIAVCYIIIVVIIWRKTSSGTTTTMMTTTTTTTTTSTSKTSQFVKSGGQMYVAINNSHFREGGASSRGVIPRAKIKTIKLTLVIVLVFILCWSPYVIFDILDVFGLIPNDGHYLAIVTFMQSLSPLNSATNPLVYFLFNHNSCVRFFRCQRKPTPTNRSPISNSHTQVTHMTVRRNGCD